jgi:hypothetical protein
VTQSVGFGNLTLCPKWRKDDCKDSHIRWEDKFYPLLPHDRMRMKVKMTSDWQMFQRYLEGKALDNIHTLSCLSGRKDSTLNLSHQVSKRRLHSHTHTHVVTNIACRTIIFTIFSATVKQLIGRMQCSWVSKLLL